QGVPGAFWCGKSKNIARLAMRPGYYPQVTIYPRYSQRYSALAIWPPKELPRSPAHEGAPSGKILSHANFALPTYRSCVGRPCARLDDRSHLSGCRCSRTPSLKRQVDWDRCQLIPAIIILLALSRRGAGVQPPAVGLMCIQPPAVGL